MITKVQLPMSLRTLVLATNQGLIYVLSMVVVSGLVGGGALGFDVVTGFAQLSVFGKGLAAGLAIVLLGVMLDRITRGRGRPHRRDRAPSPSALDTPGRPRPRKSIDRRWQPWRATQNGDVGAHGDGLADGGAVAAALVAGALVLTACGSGAKVGGSSGGGVVERRRRRPRPAAPSTWPTTPGWATRPTWPSCPTS